MNITELGFGLATGLAYGLVGTVLMVLGYLLVDLMTPGRLGELIWTQRNRNAALVLSANLIGVGAIVTTAITSSDDDFVKGISSTVGYGLVGLLLMAIAFWVIDVITPGKLGTLVVDPEPHPAVWVTAASYLSVAAIVSAAIA
jgi:uncharacterized membrane protein YjfL (UPF0719 family)